MSPAVAAYFTGAQSDRTRPGLVYVPRAQESVPQTVFERTAKALKVPLTSDKLERRS